MEQHGVTSNGWENNRFTFPAIETGPEGMFPTIFRVIREQKPDAHTAATIAWASGLKPPATWIGCPVTEAFNP